jgi:hypothetical protein
MAKIPRSIQSYSCARLLVSGRADSRPISGLAGNLKREEYQGDEGRSGGFCGVKHVSLGQPTARSARNRGETKRK